MIYDLRSRGESYELSGGRLSQPLKYSEPDAIEYATRMVGFLSQITGGELRIFDSAGELQATKHFRASVPPRSKSELGNV